MEDFKVPATVEWSNRRVLTTAQLADCYKCTAKQIKQNFNKNRDRFVEGTHYFKIEGEALAKFKNWVDEIDPVQNRVDEIDSVQNQVDKSYPQVSKHTSTLYLWTARGAARHAKMLSTDKAWEVFEKLEDFYFTHNESANALEPAPVPALPARKCNALIPGYACVYVPLLSNGLVKIGYSTNPRPRVAKAKRDQKATVADFHVSDFLPEKLARFVEWACHEKFSSRRVKGEYFAVPFEEVCEAVDKFVSVVISFPTKESIIIALKKLIADSKHD